jgi:glycosyltransferase involved in cell wall biosynthesis
MQGLVSTIRLGFDMTPAFVSPAGVGRYAHGMRGALARRSDVELHPLASTGSQAGGALGRVARGIVREGLYYPFLLARRARHAGAEVLHCPAPYGPRTGGLPLVLSAHDVLPLSHPELFTRTMTAHMRYVSVPNLRRADRVVCGSEHVRGELVERVGVDPERVSVTAYGVDERFRPTEPDAAWLRGRFGVEGEYLLCVGTLEPRKNLLTALKAFRLVAARSEGRRLVIVGARGWRNELFERELRESARNVVIAGSVSDDELVRLYGGAACLLFPSLGEGIGFPVLEAMACGTPVVTSDRTSLPEVAGDAGILVDPTSPEQIAEAVERILDDRRLRAVLGERGLERSAPHTWPRCAEATLEVYRAALAR